MAYVPLIAFGLAVAWIIWRGFKAKQEYLRAKAQEEQIRRQESTSALQIKLAGDDQGQGAELAGALAGGGHKIVQGFGQGRR